MFGRQFILACTTAAAIAASAGASFAAPVVLDFEGVTAHDSSAGYPAILNYYNGGTSAAGTSGTNYGVEFGANALLLCLNTETVACSNTSRGGLAPGSEKGALFFTDGSETFMNYAAGFDTGFSFFYSAISQAGSVHVYDGLNGTGNILATIVLGVTSTACGGEYGAMYCPFVAAGASFAGIGKSIGFGGVANYIVFDDVTFGSATPGVQPVPVPGALPLLATGVAALGFAGRFRKRKAA